MSGKVFNWVQFSNIYEISETFVIFHFDISGKDNRCLHSENNEDKLLIFEIFHLEIFGSFVKEEHFANKYIICITLDRFHIDSSGNEDNEEHP